MVGPSGGFVASMGQRTLLPDAAAVDVTGDGDFCGIQGPADASAGCRSCRRFGAGMFGRSGSPFPQRLRSSGSGADA